MRTSLTLQVLLFAGGAAALAQSPGTFTATGNMTAPRAFHTSTLLPDGAAVWLGK
jgi:hypothetical protein